jgi:hypothetical protein
MSLEKLLFVSSDLVLVEPARTSVYLPRMGEFVILRSGSPPMMVVDTDGVGDEITVAWSNDHNDKAHEMTLPAACLDAYDETKEQFEEGLGD